MKRVHSIGKPLHGQRGVVLILFALLLVILLGLAAFAIDAARINLTKIELQNAADAAALAGVRKYSTSDSTAAKNEAIHLATRNYANGSLIDASSVTATAASVTGYTYAIKVRILLSGIPLFFAPVFGISSRDVSATATAVQSTTPTTHSILVSK